MALTRRAVVGGALALVAGCSVRPQAAPSSSSAEGPRPIPQPSNVHALLGGAEFYIAHRGSGDNWPEHTLEAYTNSLRAGAHAVEISVRRTKDNVLICHHDADLRRTSGVTGTIADMTWEQLSKVKVDAQAWLGPAASPRPLSRLVDVLESLPQGCLAFVEDKDGTSTKQLLDLLDEQPNSLGRFVWKQWGNASQHLAAQERGYVSWGYFGTKELAQLKENGADFDAIGVEVRAEDLFITSALSVGRPLIAWEVHRRSDRDRLRNLGVQGMMCSNIPYVMSASASADKDSFKSGLRAAGDLPYIADRAWSQQPIINPDGATITIDQATDQGSYLLGSIGPVAGSSYTLEAKLSFTKIDARLRAGLAICCSADNAYSPLQGNAVGAYQVALAADGTITLGEHASGWSAPRTLASIQTAPVSPGDPVELVIDVDPQRITIRRGGHPQEQTVRSLNHRGGYVHLWTAGGVASFSDVSAT